MLSAHKFYIAVQYFGATQKQSTLQAGNFSGQRVLTFWPSRQSKMLTAYMKSTDIMEGDSITIRLTVGFN
jgi:hypothetical protein